MKTQELYELPGGTRVLLQLSEGGREEGIGGLCASMPESFRQRADLNENTLVSMDITTDSDPGRFSDLAALCSRLVTAAGRRSHFEGLLLLNISELMEPDCDEPRLKALGELLAMPDGLASRCVTVLYGPRNQRELLICADLLDADGCLMAAELEDSSRCLTLAQLLEREQLSCESREVQEQLQEVMTRMAAYRDFMPVKLLRSCRAGGLITRASLDRAVSDPLSYMNRICKRAELGVTNESARRIGFGRE